MPDVEPYPYVYIKADGTARELYAGERAWLETECELGDGTAPYVNDSYDERNGWGELNGHLKRAALPAGTPLADAPAENPNRPMSQKDLIAWLRSKGARVTENGGG